MRRVCRIALVVVLAIALLPLGLHAVSALAQAVSGTAAFPDEAAAIESIILAHPATTYSIVVLAGAIYSWVDKRYFDKSINSNLLQYFTTAAPGHSGATITLLIAAQLPAWMSSLLIGMGWVAIVQLAWTTGYFIDASVNRGKAA